MVPSGQPRHKPVGDGPDDGGQLHGQPPKAEELGDVALWRKVAHERPARRLAGAEANADEVSRDPEYGCTLRRPDQQHGPDPKHEIDRKRRLVADTILHLPE